MLAIEVVLPIKTTFQYYGGFKLYIVMENCGESLRKTMVDCLYKRNLGAVFRAYSDSLRALEYIHGQNVMHRDISPVCLHCFFH